MTYPHGMKTSLGDLCEYRTKDGSMIRELMNQRLHTGCPMSLAEASIPSGCMTLRHVHGKSHELYHITQGMGRMHLGDAVFEITEGDTVSIEPGTPHCIENTGGQHLMVLCCCCPPYDHEDTDVLG